MIPLERTATCSHCEHDEVVRLSEGTALPPALATGQRTVEKTAFSSRIVFRREVDFILSELGRLLRNPRKVIEQVNAQENFCDRISKLKGGNWPRCEASRHHTP
jgi:hypothetical protein